MVQRLALLNGQESSLAKIASKSIILSAPSKTQETKDFQSEQPLASLYEQSMFIFFEAIVLQLMEKLQQNHEDMSKRHINLE